METPSVPTSAVSSIASLLIVQGEETVTIPQGGIPVLYIATDVIQHLAERVATAVNFLRCGCPRVQLMWTNMSIENLLQGLFIRTTLWPEKFEFLPHSIPYEGDMISYLLITRTSPD